MSTNKTFMVFNDRKVKTNEEGLYQIWDNDEYIGLVNMEKGGWFVDGRIYSKIAILDEHEETEPTCGTCKYYRDREPDGYMFGSCDVLLPKWCKCFVKERFVKPDDNNHCHYWTEKD